MTKPVVEKLDKCVRTLKSISRNLSSKSPSQIADVYLAAVGLLCHLKVDQATLRAACRKNPKGQCPSPEKTPAITAVLQDPKLFDALIGCLKATGGTGSGDGERSDLGAMSSSRGLHVPSASHHHHLLHSASSSILTGAGRKRTNSVTADDSSASKAIKLSHSPTPSSARIYSRHQVVDTSTSYEYSPTLNVQVVAATIIFMAFSHLDHWPVALVKAYAEDCFGPRLWVDNERCKLLVDNLRLVHKPKGGDDSEDNNNGTTMDDACALDEAALVSDSYSKLQDLIAEDEAGSDHASPSQQVRRGSLSSAGSGGPTSQLASLSSLPSLPRANSRDEKDSVISNGDTEKKKKKKTTKPSTKPPKAKGEDDDGSSSSSGEEDEEVIVTTKSAGGDDVSSPKRATEDRPASPTSSHVGSDWGTTESLSATLSKRRLYPLLQQKMNFSRVRQRYFGVNKQNAYNAISSSLSERLDMRAKQNSGLLQSLHSFTSIPAVRSVVAGNLERWLQSPGLSGLARTLFTFTVKQIANVDPPLPADTEAIRKILSMRLKANQLSAHIENVTAIAATIPNGSVARQIYHQLLSEILVTLGRGADASTSDHLKMVGAVYSTMPKGVSSDGIAASLLMVIGNSIGPSSAEQNRMERRQLVKHLKHFLQLISQNFGASFDFCKLLESLLSYNISDEAWTVQDEEDRARLVFQCIMLLVPPPPKDTSRNPTKSIRKGVPLTPADADPLKVKLTAARKLVLTWFCADYGPQLQDSGTGKRNVEEVGAGSLDYYSALGGVDRQRKLPEWLTFARCLLFMEDADSPQMQRFIRSSKVLDDNDTTWYDDKYRIDRCREYGCDFDDEMMWIILKSASLEDGGINSEVALILIENLFECCSIHRRGSLRISDMMLAWELYSLAVYEPPETVVVSASASAENDDLGSKFDDAEENGEDSPMKGVTVETAHLDLPQLAYTALWWRVTVLALVMCGVAPTQIGATIWEEHHTLRAMIKMVISSRYRFPTVDCDEPDRAEMKKNEQVMREEESRIAETLFLPPKPVVKKETESSQANHGRSRISARQQQKRERALKKKREKEAAEALIAENERKKLLRAAQKTIILWDPTGAARKPPREAAELLVAVESHFGLSRIFQRNVEPDFLLMTIGKATRGAIERAYDWLIPIISDMPDTISRLHSSASCVLLLRAYSTEGDERAQLKELSAPLLRHVSESLTGRFGESDAVRAFDLLMSDVASHNPDRRRCARRVLYDSIGKLNKTGGDNTKPKSSWMLNIVRLDHAKSLVCDGIKHMCTAINYERGQVLRNLLMTVGELISHANKNNIQGNWNFASVFIGLISSRPSVCAEALDRFADLRTLGIGTVYEEFQKCIEDSSRISQDDAVSVTLCRGGGGNQVILSLPLLEASAVLLSIWKDANGAVTKDSNGAEKYSSQEKEAQSHIQNLANMLLLPIEGQESDGGLASAKILESERSAVSVESWIMLAKARSDLIARRAALTAPTGFLPRLLLCSGLPRASLLTMIDRLGKMGDTSIEKNTVFNHLLIPSAASEWDIGRLGQRREVARKLLGRLSAYLRLYNVSVAKDDVTISATFLEWLSQECTNNERSKKPKHKQKTKASLMNMSMLSEASLILETLGDCDEVMVKDYRRADVEDGGMENAKFRPLMEQRAETMGADDDNTALHESIKKAIEETRPDLLELLLRREMEEHENMLNGPAQEGSHLSDLAALVLLTFLGLEHQQDSVTRVVLAHVPHLSRLSGSPHLWQQVFSNQDGALSDILDALLCRCMASWRPHHLASCYEWLVSIGRTIGSSNYCVTRIIRYLVLTSGQQSVHIEGFSIKVPVKSIESWGMSEECVSAAVAISFEGMKRATSCGSCPGLLSRNYLPDWLILVIALAKCGRNQMKYVCESVLQRISKPTDELSLPLLRAVFLRLYVSNPQGMNLGTALIRAVLMEAAQEYSVAWLSWRSPLDDQLEDMLETVTGGSEQRLVRPLADLSKKHPLLILRKSHVLSQFLERDAAVAERGAKDMRGVVQGRGLGALNALKSGKMVKVDVKYWGFRYTEYIWIALLDIMCAIPGPVLFGCGLSMGFLEFLHVNVRLVFVQSQLGRSERDFRLREKLKEVFVNFRKDNQSGWDRWMTSREHGMPSLGEMRNVMICCDFLEAKEISK